MTTMSYEPPSLQLHEQDRLVNTHGQPDLVISELGGVAVEKLVSDYGSPLIVFEESVLRKRARAMRAAFTSRYPKVRFGWSYKTNYLDAVCGLLHQEGWDAEVVSELEYDMARRLGIPGTRILCNGAHKPRRWLQRTIEEGAYVQLDHFDELILLEQLARERGVQVAVGIRVNLVAESLGAAWERFGFHFESGEALDAALRVCQSHHLRLTGVHCHLGTFIPDPQAYRESARKLVSLIEQVEEHTQGHLDCRIERINLGGGFPSGNTLAIPLPGNSQPPPIEDYAEAICDELHDLLGDRKPLPELCLESGRALCDDAGTLITTVSGTRRLSSGARGVVLDGGLNILYTAHWYRHAVRLGLPVLGSQEDTILYGPLCMNIDALAGPLRLPPVTVGHRVLLQCVGAYNVTQWMQFSQLRPAVVMVTSDGQVEVIRRAETIADVKAPEKLPSRFAPTAIPSDRR